MQVSATRLAICGAIAAGLAVAPVGRSQSSAAELVLKSVSVDLPNGDRMFPDGPGAEAINNNCLVCHSAGMVLNQPALPKTAWAAEVHKMIATYKAPVSDADAAAIVDYLARTKGAD